MHFRFEDLNAEASDLGKYSECAWTSWIVSYTWGDRNRMSFSLLLGAVFGLRMTPVQIMHESGVCNPGTALRLGSQSGY